MITHLHHIVPTHAGGSDDPSNLVRLTIEEHAEAHRVLFEQHGRPEDRLAWMALSGMISKEEIVRQAMLIGAKKGGRIGGQRGGRAGKGKKKPAGFAENISAKMTGAGNPMFGTTQTVEQRAQRSRGVKRAVDRIGADQWTGTNNLIGSVAKRLKDGTHPSQVSWQCEHCGTSSKGIGNYKRWHGQKCKMFSELPSSSTGTGAAN